MKIVKQSAPNWNKFAWYEENINSSKPTNRFEENNNSSNQRAFDLPNCVTFSEFPEIKYSFYNISKVYSDGEVIFNSASEAVVILTNEERKTVENFNNGISPEVKDQQLFEKLFELGFYVRKEDTEVDKIHLIRKRTMVLERDVKSFVICPTYECNARCFFCFAHDDVRKSFKMSFQTADEVLNFIYSQIRENDEVIFIWFGGEPLMAEDVIDYIIGNFNAHYEGKVKYSSVFQTNGSLLTDRLLDKAISDWHAKDFQISIEAYQNEHDKRKSYRNKDVNQYELVFKNVERILSRNTHCLLRIHIDNKNIADYPKILDDLEPYKDCEKLTIYATTLHVPEHTSKFDSYVHFKQFNEFYSIIYKELFNRGFYVDIKQIIPQRKTIRCVARSMNSFLIGADGKLYRCEQENHVDENSVGDCKSGVIHNERLAVFMDMDVDEKCETCKFLPICQGGCKYYWLRNNPDISPCIRQSHFMDTIFDMIHDWENK